MFDHLNSHHQSRAYFPQSNPFPHRPINRPLNHHECLLSSLLPVLPVSLPLSQLRNPLHSQHRGPVGFQLSSHLPCLRDNRPHSQADRLLISPLLVQPDHQHHNLLPHHQRFLQSILHLSQLVVLPLGHLVPHLLNHL